MKTLILATLFLQSGLEEREKRVEEYLARLERTMLRVMDVLDTKQKVEIDRLRRGLRHLQENMVRTRAKKASEEIRRKNLEEALEEGKRIQTAIKELIEILEGRLRIEDIRPHMPKGEKLRAIEEELRRVKEEQESIRKKTWLIDRKKVKTRADVIRAREQAKRQSGLAKTMGEIEKLLRQEDEEVFAFAVDIIELDMEDSAAMLNRAKTGDRQRGLQDHIIRSLERLLITFKQRRDELETLRPPPGNGGGPNGNPGKPRILPSQAALRLIREMQKDILKRTRSLTTTFKPGREDFLPLEKSMLRRLADEQGRLSILLKTLIKKYRGDLKRARM